MRALQFTTKVRVFVDPPTAQLLDEQTLDAQLDEGGEVNFFLASRDAQPELDAARRRGPESPRED